MPTYTHCVECGKPNNGHPVRQRCIPCTRVHNNALTRARLAAIRAGTHKPRVRLADQLRDHNVIAHKLVAAAIRYGFLLHPTNLKCTDCGGLATAYDHRDYNKPLDVDPVCTGCNNRRGPGIPMVLPKN